MTHDLPRASRLPMYLLALAAIGIGALGIRLVAAERGNVEREHRAALEIEAARSAQRLSDFVAEQIDAAVEGRLELVARVRAGRFEVPNEPLAADVLRFVPGRDAEGEFLLNDAESCERAGDLDRALGALRVAAENSRDPMIRAIASTRAAAIHRSRGHHDDAFAAGRAALESMDPKLRDTARDALLLRHLEHPADPALIVALTRLVGGGDDAFARALLHTHPQGRDALSQREVEFERIDRVSAARLEPKSGAAAALLESSLLLARRDESDALQYFEIPLPREFEALRRVSADTPLAVGALVVRAPIGALLPGRFIESSRSDATIATAARTRTFWIFLLFVLVVGAIVLALFAWNSATKRARAHAQARSDFVARVGHDLRTPLSLIRMYAETLADGRVPDPAQTLEFTGIIARESERLTRLVGAVLDFARVQDAGAAAERKTLDLRDLAAEVVDAVRPLLNRARIAVSLDLADQPVQVTVDPDALRSSLFNLLDNALQHASSGRSIVVRCESREGVASLEVEDRGPGIEERELERVFERFVRGSGAIGKGTGLGLALVNEVAIAHSGRASAHNRQGGGLVCSIELPLDRVSPSGSSSNVLPSNGLSSNGAAAK